MIYKVTQRWGVRDGEEGRGGWEGEVGGGKKRREERGGGEGWMGGGGRRRKEEEGGEGRREGRRRGWET